MIGFPYISVPKRKIFAASQPKTTTVAARIAAEITTSTLETLPSAIRANMALLEVKGMKEATFMRRLLLSFIPVMVRIKDTTKIIIAQRISSVQEADQILVLEDGKIIGHGTHEELLKTCEAYSEIYTTQIGNQSIRAGEEAAV